MLEMVRAKFMQRMCMKKKKGELTKKYDGGICPKILKSLVKCMEWTTNCWLKEASSNKFNIATGLRAYGVDLEQRIRSCRKRQL